MEQYKEYPIRCKTCNEPLDCYAPTYEALCEQMSNQEALDHLGLIAYCSRIAMMNPTFVLFNMENRAVIEGYKDVDADPDPKMIFAQCIGDPRIQKGAPRNVGHQPHKIPVRTFQPQGSFQPQGAPQAPTLRPALGMSLGPRVVVKLEPIEREGEVEEPEEPKEPKGPEGPKEPEEPEEQKYISIINPTSQMTEPVLVGIPTINPDPSLRQDIVNVGAGKQIKVLNGRYYLAR